MRTGIERDETTFQLVGNNNRYFESLTTLQSLQKAYQELSPGDLRWTYLCFDVCGPRRQATTASYRLYSVEEIQVCYQGSIYLPLEQWKH